MVFGSCSSGLDLPFSDLDIAVLNLSPQDTEWHKARDDSSLGYSSSNVVSYRSKAMEKLAKALRETSWAHDVKVVALARVPVVKYRGLYDTNVDVAFHLIFADPNTCAPVSIVSHLTHLEFAVAKPLIWFLKYFLWENSLREVWNGGMGSYLLSVLVASFLRIRDPLSASSNSPSSEYIAPQFDLGAILLDFLHFLSAEVDYQKFGLSLKGLYLKNSFNYLSVLDPNDANNDLGNACFLFPAVLRAFSELYQTLNHVSRNSSPAPTFSSSSSSSPSSSIMHASTVSSSPPLSMSLSITTSSSFSTPSSSVSLSIALSPLSSVSSSSSSSVVSSSLLLIPSASSLPLHNTFESCSSSIAQVSCSTDSSSSTYSAFTSRSPSSSVSLSFSSSSSSLSIRSSCSSSVLSPSSLSSIDSTSIFSLQSSSVSAPAMSSSVVPLSTSSSYVPPASPSPRQFSTFSFFPLSSWSSLSSTPPSWVPMYSFSFPILGHVLPSLPQLASQVQAMLSSSSPFPSVSSSASFVSSSASSSSISFSLPCVSTTISTATSAPVLSPTASCTTPISPSFLTSSSSSSSSSPSSQLPISLLSSALTLASCLSASSFGSSCSSSSSLSSSSSSSSSASVASSSSVTLSCCSSSSSHLSSSEPSSFFSSSSFCSVSSKRIPRQLLLDDVNFPPLLHHHRHQHRRHSPSCGDVQKSDSVSDSGATYSHSSNISSSISSSLSMPSVGAVDTVVAPRTRIRLHHASVDDRDLNHDSDDINDHMSFRGNSNSSSGSNSNSATSAITTKLIHQSNNCGALSSFPSSSNLVSALRAQEEEEGATLTITIPAPPFSIIPSPISTASTRTLNSSTFPPSIALPPLQLDHKVKDRVYQQDTKLLTSSIDSNNCKTNSSTLAAAQVRPCSVILSDVVKKALPIHNRASDASGGGFLLEMERADLEDERQTQLDEVSDDDFDQQVDRDLSVRTSDKPEIITDASRASHLNSRPNIMPSLRERRRHTHRTQQQERGSHQEECDCCCTLCHCDLLSAPSSALLASSSCSLHLSVCSRTDCCESCRCYCSDPSASVGTIPVVSLPLILRCAVSSNLVAASPSFFSSTPNSSLSSSDISSHSSASCPLSYSSCACTSSATLSTLSTPSSSSLSTLAHLSTDVSGFKKSVTLVSSSRFLTVPSSNSARLRSRSHSPSLSYIHLDGFALTPSRSVNNILDCTPSHSQGCSPLSSPNHADSALRLSSSSRTQVKNKQQPTQQQQPQSQPQLQTESSHVNVFESTVRLDSDEFDLERDNEPLCKPSIVVPNIIGGHNHHLSISIDHDGCFSTTPNNNMSGTGRRIKSNSFCSELPSKCVATRSTSATSLNINSDAIQLAASPSSASSSASLSSSSLSLSSSSSSFPFPARSLSACSNPSSSLASMPPSECGGHCSACLAARDAKLKAQAQAQARDKVSLMLQQASFSLQSSETTFHPNLPSPLPASDLVLRRSFSEPGTNPSFSDSKSTISLDSLAISMNQYLHNISAVSLPLALRSLSPYSSSSSASSASASSPSSSSLSMTSSPQFLSVPSFAAFSYLLFSSSSTDSSSRMSSLPSRSPSLNHAHSDSSPRPHPQTYRSASFSSTSNTLPLTHPTLKSTVSLKDASKIHSSDTLQVPSMSRPIIDTRNKGCETASASTALSASLSMPSTTAISCVFPTSPSASTSTTASVSMSTLCSSSSATISHFSTTTPTPPLTPIFPSAMTSPSSSFSSSPLKNSLSMEIPDMPRSSSFQHQNTSSNQLPSLPFSLPPASVNPNKVVSSCATASPLSLSISSLSALSSYSNNNSNNMHSSRGNYYRGGHKNKNRRYNNFYNNNNNAYNNNHNFNSSSYPSTSSSFAQPTQPMPYSYFPFPSPFAFSPPFPFASSSSFSSSGSCSTHSFASSVLSSTTTLLPPPSSPFSLSIPHSGTATSSSCVSSFAPLSSLSSCKITTSVSSTDLSYTSNSSSGVCANNGAIDSTAIAPNSWHSLTSPSTTLTAAAVSSPHTTPSTPVYPPRQPSQPPYPSYNYDRNKSHSNAFNYGHFNSYNKRNTYHKGFMNNNNNNNNNIVNNNNTAQFNGNFPNPSNPPFSNYYHHPNNYTRNNHHPTYSIRTPSPLISHTFSLSSSSVVSTVTSSSFSTISISSISASSSSSSSSPSPFVTVASFGNSSSFASLAQSSSAEPLSFSSSLLLSSVSSSSTHLSSNSSPSAFSSFSSSQSRNLSSSQPLPHTLSSFSFPSGVSRPYSGTYMMSPQQQQQQPASFYPFQPRSSAPTFNNCMPPMPFYAPSQHSASRPVYHRKRMTQNNRGRPPFQQQQARPRKNYSSLPTALQSSSSSCSSSTATAPSSQVVDRPVRS